MKHTDSDTGLQLRSLVTRGGELEVSLTRVPIPVPAANEVLIRVDAAPINPSDLWLLFAGADLTTAVRSGAGEATKVTARVPEAMLRGMAARVGESMQVLEKAINASSGREIDDANILSCGYASTPHVLSDLVGEADLA